VAIPLAIMPLRKWLKRPIAKATLLSTQLLALVAQLALHVLKALRLTLLVMLALLLLAVR
jgi:hypothetical protein